MTDLEAYVNADGRDKLVKKDCFGAWLGHQYC